MTAVTYKLQRTTSPPQRTSGETVDFPWRQLYQIGGIAALLSAMFIPIQVIVFIVWPLPSTVMDWFTLFQENRLVGLVDLDLLLVIDNVLLVPIFLALYILLRRTNESVMAIATALGFLGIALFIASNPAFEMLSLSNRHAAATTDAERSVFLAAGQAMLAMWEGTAFQTAYFLGSIVGLAIGVVMLQNGIFGKMTATMGILGNAVAFGYYLPGIGVYVAVFSVLFLEIWYILIARRLFRLGQSHPGGAK
jgi:hypothetical protein